MYLYYVIEAKLMKYKKKKMIEIKNEKNTIICKIKFETQSMITEKNCFSNETNKAIADTFPNKPYSSEYNNYATFMATLL